LGSGGIAPRINFGSRWRWVASFTPRLLYPKIKNPRYALDRRLGGLQSGLDAVARRKNPSPCRESNPGRSTRSLVVIMNNSGIYFILKD
jgi:hypothetical protein